MLKLAIRCCLTLAVVLFCGDSSASPEPEAPLLHCTAIPPSVILDRRERSLDDGERLVVDALETNAATLAASYRRIEGLLREAGHEPNDFSGNALSWVAVDDSDNLVVAVYQRSPESMTRLDIFGTDGATTLAGRLQRAEQALLNTPHDCGVAYGVIDAGVRDGERDLLYALRLTDRRDHMAWGINYRIESEGDSLVEINRQHYRCSEILNRPRTPEEEDAHWARQGFNPADARRGRLRASHVTLQQPDMDFPSETQLMQLLLSNGFPTETHVWTRERYFVFRAEQPRLPTRYRAVTNPCTVTR